MAVKLSHLIEDCVATRSYGYCYLSNTIIVIYSSSSSKEAK